MNVSVAVIGQTRWGWSRVWGYVVIRWCSDRRWYRASIMLVVVEEVFYIICIIICSICILLSFGGRRHPKTISFKERTGDSIFALSINVLLHWLRVDKRRPPPPTLNLSFGVNHKFASHNPRLWVGRGIYQPACIWHQKQRKNFILHKLH